MIIYICTAMLLLLLSHFSRVRLCNPIDGSPPGSPSLGFSRQEHWSGLPFPSPMHESEKGKWSCSVVSDPQQPHVAYQAPPSIGFSRQEYWSGVPLPSPIKDHRSPYKGIKVTKKWTLARITAKNVHDVSKCGGKPAAILSLHAAVTTDPDFLRKHKA